MILEVNDKLPTQTFTGLYTNSLFFSLGLILFIQIPFSCNLLFYVKVHFYRNNNPIEHLLFYSRGFLFLKEQILVPGSIRAMCLNHRLIVLNTKYINIYASVTRRTSLHVMCVRNVASGAVL